MAPLRVGTQARARKLFGWSATGLLACLIAASVAVGHELDHAMPNYSQPAPLSAEVNAGGEGAKWDLVTTIPTGNPHTDLDFFTKGDDVYASVGTLANGPNAGGQTIIRLTKNGLVEPSYVTGHPSASCLSGSTGVTGLQHDVEAAPKGSLLTNTVNPNQDQREAQILVDATDAPGRCHDQGPFGVSQSGMVPQGGLEIIDITNPAEPKEIGLTTHVGQAHTVNIDPKRPHIAYVSSSDYFAIDSEGKRSNEAGGNAVDGIEVVDMSSCMNFPAGTTIEQKRAACNPVVFRYRWPETKVTQASHYKMVGACHELEIYPDDRIACSAVTATALFDFKGAFDDNGTPTDFGDDRLRGQPLPCFRRETSTEFPEFKTGALVVDCVDGGSDGKQKLTVQEWLKIGAPSLDGVRWIGTVPHMGVSANQDHANPAYDATKDVIVAHESELTGSGDFVLTTDERGGGVLPVGASCDPTNANVRGNGGIHAFPTKNFTTNPPRDPAAAQELHARNSQGAFAIFRAPIRTEPQANVCTSHVFQQIPGQNRIFMAWYSQGTQVVDFTENANGTIDFENVAWFIPEHANQWVSAIFKVQENADGTFTYWGATGDFALGDAGRNAIDIYKVTLPAPPRVRGQAVEYPKAPIAGVEGARAGSEPCARTTAFDRVDIRPRGRRLGFTVQRRGRESVRADLFQVTKGRRLIRRQVADLATRKSRFTLRAGGDARPGHYIVRLRTTTLGGLSDIRQFALRLSRRGFARGPAFQEHVSCQLVEEVLLGRPVFGGSSRSSLGISFKLNDAANVSVEVRRGKRVVQRFAEKAYSRARVHRLRFSKGRARGLYTVIVKARASGRSHTTRVFARRI